MRIVIYGLGAVGGVVAAALVHAGTSVVAIARGAVLDAVQQDGLRLHHYGGTDHVDVPCVRHPSEIHFADDDLIVLCMKSQDTNGALQALRSAGVRKQPIFCCQNGVSNERAALRFFPNVHGVTVMMPATLVEPGRVATFVQPRHGVFDIGRYPHGTDDDDNRFAQTLNTANIATFPTPNVMDSKYGKLTLNLMNVVQAAVGREADIKTLAADVRAEGRAVLNGAGIAWHDVDDTDTRRQQFLKPAKLDGIPRRGGSTWQSLARGAGSIETDFLNGEIVQIARLTGQAAPLNTALQLLGAHLLATSAPAGSMTPESLFDWLESTQ